MRAVSQVAAQRVPRVGARPRALQPGAVRGPADRRRPTCSASSPPGRTSRSSRTSGSRRSSVFGLFIAIFIGIGLVSKEVERRSIYALLAKPISRPQFIAGKYAGLVLTLAVNVAVMTVALYVVLGDLTWSAIAPRSSAAWDAPGTDPRLLKAVVLIFVELMLITAIALFFSTFSTPAPLGRPHLRPLRRRALQRGAAGTSSRSSTRGRPRGWRAALITSLPDLSAFDVKTQVVHGLPVPAGYLASDRRLRRRLHRGAAARRDGHLFAAGLQVTAGRARSLGRRVAVALAAPSPCRSAADRAFPRRERRSERLLYVRSPARRSKRIVARLRCAGGRRLLDPRDPALRRRSARSARRAPIRAALPAARHDDVARSLTSTSPTASARSS